MISEQKSIKVEAVDVGKFFYEKQRGMLVEAIKGLDLTVKEHEFAVLLGPSGCGKTTFLHMVAGVEKPTTGKVHIDGKEVTGPGRDRGIVFQDHALFPWKTVIENISYGLNIKKIPKKEAQKICREFIEMVDLKGFENAYPHTLSGGMRQRVAIARALAYNPSILLMDEPFGALDAQTRSYMIKDLARIHQDTKKTVLFVTHSIDESILLADRIFIFSARPSKIKYVIPIELPHPRSIDDPKAVELRNQIMAILSPEVQRARESEITELKSI